MPIFGHGNSAQAAAYLHFAWHQATGQYGYQQHWVAEHHQTVVGLVTCWHDHLGEDFGRETLRSISRFYDVEAALDVLLRSQQLTGELAGPGPHELGIGHLAIHPLWRRQGIGAALLTFMQQQARQLSKQELTLAVHHHNTPARLFYLAQGFTEHYHHGRFIQLTRQVAAQVKEKEGPARDC
ncbi:GNAT family N-acetyltransferase [Salinimonas marina]|uniref:GNAT family N-acetyltransferase n=1 Tax=Salinimonas marina TaxID=2785918 RepID=UPI001E307BB9|nr:GNAT family N-acetyltransferase [Salinimonas marina]